MRPLLSPIRVILDRVSPSFSAKPQFLQDHDTAITVATMVRVKHRYLLVNILYPELSDGPLNPELPDILRFHQPTTDKVQDRDLIRGIKAEADYMFGDYGAGAISDSSGRKRSLMSLYPH